MKFFKNLSIRFKILIPVGLLGCLVLALAVTSIISARQIMEASEEISANYAMKIEGLGDISTHYQSLRRVAFAHIVADNKALEEELEAESETLKEEIGNVRSEITQELDANVQGSFMQFNADYNNYLAIYSQILELSGNGQKDEAAVLANEDLKEAGTSLSNRLASMRTLYKDAMQEAIAHQTEVYNRVVFVIIVLVILGAVIFAFVVWVSWKWACKRLIAINRQLRDVIAAIDAGRGDLTMRVQCFCTDEIGTLAAGINTFIETLQGIMGQINTSSGQLGSIVNLVSNKVLTANDNSTSISSVMEQLSASMEEISSTLTTIKENVDVVDDNIIVLSNESQGLYEYAAGMQGRAEILEQGTVENKKNTGDVVNGIIEKL